MINKLTTNVVKAKFLKEGKPSGREYTYFTDEDVLVGEEVLLFARGKESDGVITGINIDPKEIEPFKDIAKTIIKKPNKQKDEVSINE